jgi:hypothetical protein
MALQRDFILRMIEAVAAALARAVGRRRQGDLQGAREELAAAARELLGTVGSLAAHADARTAVDLLSDPRRVVLWVRLLIEDAELLHEAGYTGESSAVRRRARDLAGEVRRRDTVLSDEDRDFVSRVGEESAPGDRSPSRAE